MKRIFISSGIVLLGLVMSSTSVWAQATAQISGTVTDSTGALIPGVEVTASQTDTGISRTVVSNETGSYVMANLPIGPYRLEASLPGFSTYVQSGIVLQVNNRNVINIALEVGQVAQTIEVTASALMVETRNTGIGQIMENTSILELPLNGRSLINLIELTPAVTPASQLDASGRDATNKGNVSVAGGVNSGLNYTLDGAFHNNPFTDSYMSMPFPDALQEFKVETSATGAESGVKSAGTVSLVTKSGTNEFHGNVFEFVRNGKFNAGNAFAERRDTLKRNQFGGTIGGPILSNRLFFFAGYQGTTVREDPAQTIAFVPTPAILAGDFTAFASPLCNRGGQVNLSYAPDGVELFNNNVIDPALYSAPALALASMLPSSQDPCGRTIFGMPRPTNEHITIGRIDYQRSDDHSMFARYLIETVDIKAPHTVTGTLLSVRRLGVGRKARSQAFTIGDTYLFGPNVVNSLRLVGNRQWGEKPRPDFSDNPHGASHIGINAFNYGNNFARLEVDGAFDIWCSGCGDGPATTATFSVSDDLNVIRGDHQLALGAAWAGWWVNSYSRNYTHMPFEFNGDTTGLGMGDFFVGRAAEFGMGPPADQNKKSQYIGLYAADTWSVSPSLTLNYGLRWEPYFPIVHLDGAALNLDLDAMRAGIRSTLFDNTPPGVSFPGDPGHPGIEGMHRKWWNFSPRVGLGWDVTGDGRTSVRASGGMFYDFVDVRSTLRAANGAPWAPRFIRNDVLHADPWADEPGGDPFPVKYGRFIERDQPWPRYATFATTPFDNPNKQVLQWNLSIQRQIGSDWLVTANYLGNGSYHLATRVRGNPAVYVAGKFDANGNCSLNGQVVLTGKSGKKCSSNGNRNQRRWISLENQELGEFFGDFERMDASGTASYHGLILSVQRRAASGVTLNGNYTWSHCISDPRGAWTDPFDRRFDRGDCNTDRRHVFNMSALAETPEFSSPALRAVASGWRFSPIIRVLSGSQMSITTSKDRAMSGIKNQRVDQLLSDPYGDKSVDNFLNPAAFALAETGKLGTVGANNVRGPRNWVFDVALSRGFQFRETQRLELRAEAFNLTNSLRMENPVTRRNSSTFGRVLGAQDPRIMQFVVKYFF